MTKTGAIQLEAFTGLTKLPQKAATAWTAVEGLIGVSYKPLLYVGEQVVDGGCWRCGSPVHKKNLKQWFIKITKQSDVEIF